MDIEFDNMCKDKKECKINFDYFKLNDPDCVDEILKRVYASKNIDFYNSNHSLTMNISNFDIQ
jgi:hypothetical protein